MKLDINDIVNGSLAGGVMIGASSNLLGKQKGIGISLIIGFFAGFIAILWDRKVRPVLA